jgi:hypothetical protein
MPPMTKNKELEALFRPKHIITAAAWVTDPSYDGELQLVSHKHAAAAAKCIVHEHVGDGVSKPLNSESGIYLMCCKLMTDSQFL